MWLICGQTTGISKVKLTQFVVASVAGVDGRSVSVCNAGTAPLLARSRDHWLLSLLITQRKCLYAFSHCISHSRSNRKLRRNYKTRNLQCKTQQAVAGIPAVGIGTFWSLLEVGLFSDYSRHGQIYGHTEPQRNALENSTQPSVVTGSG